MNAEVSGVMSLRAGVSVPSTSKRAMMRGLAAGILLKVVLVVRVVLDRGGEEGGGRVRDEGWNVALGFG